MLRSGIYFFLGMLTIIAASCIEPYGLPENQSAASYLVVDGFLDSNTGAAQVKLTRSHSLSEGGKFESEKGATVRIEIQNGSSISLSEGANGLYTATGLTINPAWKYRLTVQVMDGKVYASTFVGVVQTPPIDSVTWLPVDDGVKFRVNTHNDSPQGTKFYMWRYTETWEYHASHFSNFKYVDGEAVRREDDEFVYTCWDTEPSSEILVKSTERFSQNIVSQFSLNFIPAGDRRLSIKYSILVQQVGLEKEAYEFWSKLEQTTENVGGLFDPQPGQVLGNMECISDPTEPALGIFHIGNTVEQRIFLEFRELPGYLQVFGQRPYCPLDTVAIEELGSFPSGHLLVSEVTEGIAVLGYTHTSTSCADCRFEGGTLNKPAFWE